MTAFICVTCGTQFAPSEAPLTTCPICEDARQWVPPSGQAWTTMEALRTDHRNRIEPEGEVVGIGTEPSFAIGQRALLVRTPAMNVLWDSVTLLDDATVEAVMALGGLDAIAVSHPHFYAAVVAWSRAFGGVPVYLHEADRGWVMRPDPCLAFWGGERHALAEELTLHRLGGHFPGSAVLHWAGGADGQGALFTGDTVQVVPDQGWVSFMYSYPNLIPLPAREVRHIAGALAPVPFDRLYGGWWGRVIAAGAQEAVRRSADRYLRALDAPGL